MEQQALSDLTGERREPTIALQLLVFGRGIYHSVPFIG